MKKKEDTKEVSIFELKRKLVEVSVKIAAGKEKDLTAARKIRLEIARKLSKTK